jgi:hypothetical protein
MFFFSHGEILNDRTRLVKAIRDGPPSDVKISIVGVFPGQILAIDKGSG